MCQIDSLLLTWTPYEDHRAKLYSPENLTMAFQPLEEFGRRVLADLGRQTLNAHRPTMCIRNDSHTFRPCSDIPATNDLLSYLRSTHRFLNSREMAAILGWDLSTLVRRIRSDQFPGLKDKGRWKFDPGTVSVWLEEHLYPADQSKSHEEPTR